MNNLLPVALLTLTCFAQDSDESRWTTRPIRGVVKLENGQPAIGFDVYVPGVGGEKLAVVKTSASGTFTLRVAPGVNMPTVFARSADGELMGSFDPFEQSRLLRITAKPKRTIQCTVLGVDGQPLAEADVGVVARYALVASGKSDADGKCVLEVPRDIAVELVFAKKDDHGFDYYENFTIYPTIIRQPPPESIKLKLEGATTCKVTLTDPNGQPVAGVPVAPWLIERVGKIDDANIGGCSNLSETTNKAGVAVFRWFPKDCERSIEFLVADRKHYIGRDLVATRRNDEIATTVYKRISVTGVVTHTDGSVAAGIELQAESRGGNYFRGYARTNSRGEYRFDIYPNQTTSIEVIDNRWGADAQSVTVAPGQPKADVNLSLLQGATLRGTISAEGGGNVDSGTHVTIISSGNVVRWEYVRPDGTYRARLGPGTYRVSLPGGQKSESITFSDGDDVVRDAQVAVVEQTGVFEGLVVDDAGKPVPGAKVYAAGTDQFRTSYHGVADPAGRFWLERKGNTVFMCSHPDQPLAALVEVPPKKQAHTFKLTVSGAVTGRLLSEDGQQALANSEVMWRVSCPGFQPFTVTTRTDADGRFQFYAPVKAGGKLSVRYQLIGDGPEELSFRRFLEIGVAAIDQLETVDLGDVKVSGAEDTRPKKR